MRLCVMVGLVHLSYAGGAPCVSQRCQAMDRCNGRTILPHRIVSQKSRAPRWCYTARLPYLPYTPCRQRARCARRRRAAAAAAATAVHTVPVPPAPSLPLTPGDAGLPHEHPTPPWDPSRCLRVAASMRLAPLAQRMDHALDASRPSSAPVAAALTSIWSSSLLVVRAAVCFRSARPSEASASSEYVRKWELSNA